MMTSSNQCQNMYSSSRNSCTKDFGDWSKCSDLRQKKLRGGSPLVEASRFNDLLILTVEKRDSYRSLRLCLDPRNLNKAIRREHYKIPTAEDSASRLQWHIQHPFWTL